MIFFKKIVTCSVIELLFDYWNVPLQASLNKMLIFPKYINKKYQSMSQIP